MTKLPDLSSSEPITRRRMLGGSAAATALFLAGCSSAAKSGSAGGGKSGSGSSVLTLGTASDLSPTTFLRAGTNTAVLSLVFDSLAVLDPQTLKATPSVATSWSWNADKTELTVNLRDDVKYHTGRTLAPKDVIFSVKAVQDPAAGAQIGGMATLIKAMTQTGPHQLKFVLEKPISSFTDLLVMTPLVDSETYKQLASAKQVVGTGPFVFKSWTPATSVIFARNLHYWQAGLPHLDKVTVRVFSSEQALVSALRANEIDIAWNLVPSDAALLAKGGSYPSVSTDPLFSEWYVGANVKAAPFNDLKVRQAVAYALDRDRIVKQAFAGFGTPSCLPWRPSAPGLTAADASYYGYDPAKAKALFKAAGSPSATIPVTVGAGNTITAAIVNIVQYNLSAVGFKVKVQEVQSTQVQTLLEEAKMPGLWINSVGQVDLSVATVLLGNAPFKVTANTSNVTDPTYVSLANKLIYASSDAEVATAEQAVTRYILEQAWHITFGHVPTVAARTPKLSGVGSTGGLAIDLTNAKLA